MVFFVSILLAFVLPSVMGLTLNTPSGAVAGGTLLVTWTTVAGDPTFSLLLVNAQESIDLAQGIAPSALNDTVGLDQALSGSFSLQAVAADNIGTVLSTTQPFTISPAGSAAADGASAGAAADNAASGAAAGTAATGAAAAGTAATGAAAGSAGTAAAATASAAKAAAGNNNKAAAKAKPQPQPQSHQSNKHGRSVTSAKFGRRDLYRD